MPGWKALKHQLILLLKMSPGIENIVLLSHCGLGIQCTERLGEPHLVNRGASLFESM